MTEKPILEVCNLQKTYGNHKAVKDISFSVAPGTCLGLLGPNGAGKTTTIEIIEDIIPATSGTVYYKGQPRKTTFREEIGIQFQHTSLLKFLTVKETLQTFANLFAKPQDLDTLIATCELEAVLQNRNDRLSGGQAQRLMLALALINRPELIFLDEPSTGLDPQARRNLWNIVEQVLARGKTVIMTTHSMEEAEHLCDRIAIIDQGLIIAEGTPKALVEKYCGNATISLPAAFNINVLNRLDVQWKKEGATIRINTDYTEKILKQLTETGEDLSGISVASANLEDVFLTLTGRQLRE